MKYIDNYTTMTNMTQNEIYSFPDTSVDQSFYYRIGNTVYWYHIESKECFKYQQQENGNWKRRKVILTKQLKTIFSPVIMEGML